jgi:cytochrome c553
MRAIFMWERIAIIRIQYNITTCFVAIALLATTTAYAGESTGIINLSTSNGDPVAGKSKSTLCQSCHGELGLSLEVLIPNLAGQYPEYITKQLRDFQSGARKNQFMSIIAKSIDDWDLPDIVTYFASQERMHGGGWGDNQTAKKLFLKGDMSRNIWPCSNCHGIKGKGKVSSVAVFPVIGGQHKEYLRAQLINWRNGARTNSPSDVMNQIAKSLTNAEIEALAGYISGL